MTIKLKLDPDYHCLPIWELEKEDLDSRGFFYDWYVIDDLAELPIEEDTIHQLSIWATTYDSSFLDSEGNEDFSEPSLWSEEQWQSFWQEGVDLWIQLQRELGEEYEVFYNMYIPSEKRQRLLRNLDELKALQVS
jgi:hypothetical protein